MGYSYINQSFLGNLCNLPIVTGGPTTPDYKDPDIIDNILIGNIGEATFQNCNLYESGISLGYFSGYKNEIFTGEYKYQTASSGVSRSGNVIDYVTGLRYGGFNKLSGNFTNFSGILLIQSQSLNFGGQFVSNLTGSGSGYMYNGSVYGFGLGQAPNISNTPFGQNGKVVSAVTGNRFDLQFTGSGSFSLQFSDSATIIMSGTSNFSGNLNSFADNISGKGTQIFSGYEKNTLFTGRRNYNPSGYFSGRFSGIRSGTCVDVDISDDKPGCGPYAPFLSGCSGRGNLNVRILYPPNRSIFSVPIVSGQQDFLNAANNTGQGFDRLNGLNLAFPPIGTGIIPLTINFYGDIVPSPDEDPDVGDDNDNPDDEEDIDAHCPYAIWNNPTCTGGNTGRVSFVIENTHPNVCNIYPPYSGSVTKSNALGASEVPMFVYSGNESYVFPNILTFNNLSPGIYTMHLSGVNSQLDIIAPVTFADYLPIDGGLLQNASNCSTPNGIYRFQWNNRVINYNVEGTPYNGQSTTGFTATGLYYGEYTAYFNEQDRECETEINFVVDNENKVRFSNTITGADCVGPYAGINGAVRVSMSGGYPPYSGKWVYPDSIYGQTGLTLTGLNKGTYTYQVSDASGCVSSTSPIVANKSSDLYAYINTTGSNIVCCQHTYIESIRLPELIGFAAGGVRPYQYSWYSNGTLVSSGSDYYTAPPGDYQFQVTDANQCTYRSSSFLVTGTNKCYNVKWSSQDLQGNQYQEREFVGKPSQLPSQMPFTYSVPGTYLIKLSIADSYGRVGLQCITIEIRGYTEVSPDSDDPVIDPDDPDIENEDEEDDDPIIYPRDEDGKIILPDITFIPDDQEPPIIPNDPGGGGGGGGITDTGGGGGGEDDPHQTRVCCTLVSNGINDLSCQTFCSSDATFCNGKDQSNHQTVDGNCSDCRNVWTVKSGSCCLCKVVGGVLSCDCLAINSCDPAAACRNEAIARGLNPDLASFKLDKNCDIASPDYGCDVGLCCTDKTPWGGIGDGCGRVCLGRMTDSECARQGGVITNRTALTCADAGYQLYRGTYYCEMYKAVCCITSSAGGACPCICNEESSCIACEQQALALQAGNPSCAISYAVTPINPNLPIDKRPSCKPQTCACITSSYNGVGGGI